jgi:hypothetical protein
MAVVDDEEKNFAMRHPCARDLSLSLSLFV